MQIASPLKDLTFKTFNKLKKAKGKQNFNTQIIYHSKNKKRLHYGKEEKVTLKRGIHGNKQLNNKRALNTTPTLPSESQLFEAWNKKRQKLAIKKNHQLETKIVVKTNFFFLKK